MTLDAAANFARGALASGIAAAATSLTLSAGNGTRFPVAPFNAVLFDATVSHDPVNDPDREVVRVTDVTGDALTVVRAQEGTVAADHHTTGHVYWLVAGPTAKMVADINAHIASLGTMSTQSAGSVAITGGSITGIADLAVADGGTGSSTAKAALATLGAKDMAGMLDRTASTLALAAGSGTTPNIQGTFTISGTYQFWSDGVLYTKSSPISVTIPATQALYFIYFDGTGTLVQSTVPWDIVSSVTTPVATVYWDPVAGVGTLDDERHAAGRDRTLHEYLHRTRGTAYDSGLLGTFADASLSVTQGTIFDEDIRHTTPGTLTKCRIWYRDATRGGRLQFDPNVSVPYKAVVGALQWDNDGVLNAVSTNRFAVNWVYASNEQSYPIEVVVSQAEYTNAAGYNAAVQPTFPNLSTREWKLIYAVVYKNSGGAPQFVQATDYRTASSVPSGGTSSIPASNVTLVPGGSVASTDVQGAVLELDAEKVPTTRTISTAAPLTGGGPLSADLPLGISVFAGAGPGAVPTSSGNITEYMRSDGGWSAPSVITPIRTVSANAALATTDAVCLVDASAGVVTVTLPSAVACIGRQMFVKKIDATANRVIIATTLSQTVDGAATRETVIPNFAVTLVSNGVNWFIL